MNDRVNGKTKLYAVIGDPVSHSISPEIHNTVFDRFHLNSVYLPLKVRAEDLEQAVFMLRKNFAGFNITVPHKERILPYLDEVVGQAKQVGAVNTVKVLDGKLIGYNTDGYGFMAGLSREGINLNGRKVLLVGAGGAARVVAHEVLSAGGVLTITDIDHGKAQALKNTLLGNMEGSSVEIKRTEACRPEYFCVINATPVGMWPDVESTPLDRSVLSGTEVVYDLIYNPYETRLMREGKALGCKTVNGLPMLFYQALKAQEFWTGLTLDKKESAAVYREVEAYLAGKILRGV